MNPIETMDSLGRITDVRQGMLYLFKCFATANQAQSNEYGGSSSLMACIASNTNNPEGMALDTTTALQQLYNAHFDNVTVNCWTTDLTGDGSQNKYALNMSVDVTEAGEVYKLANVLNDAYNVGDDLLSQITDGKVMNGS